jgi:cardiolipin synthase
MIQGVWPAWLGIIIILRDFYLGLVTVRLKQAGESFIEVSFLGKAATFNLLYALPLFLLAGNTGPGLVAKDVGWAFAIWGSALYLYSGFLYVQTSNRLLSKSAT